MSSAKLTKRAIITLAFVGALVVQAGVSFALKNEPYPGIRMPAFGSAPNRAGMFPTVVASAKITYADGTMLEPHVTELMKDFRFSSARYSFDYMFKPGSSVKPDQEVLTWLSAEARELGGGKEPVSIDMCWTNVDLDIRTASYNYTGECESTVINL